MKIFECTIIESKYMNISSQTFDKTIYYKMLKKHIVHTENKIKIMIKMIHIKTSFSNRQSSTVPRLIRRIFFLGPATIQKVYRGINGFPRQMAGLQ